MDDGMQEVAKERQPQLIEQALNLLDLKMDQTGKSSVSHRDIYEWQNGASPEELAMLQAVELHFDGISATNNGDNGGIGFGILAGNADGITRADVHDTKELLSDLRENALSREEIGILNGLGGNVSRQMLEDARAGVSAARQPVYDDLLARFDDIRNLARSDEASAVFVNGKSSGTNVNSREITPEDKAVAQGRTNDLGWWDWNG